MLQSAKLPHFTQRIADLADEPSLSTDELKARFDACPEELRGKHNALIDGLTAPEAAAALGFGATAGVPVDNVQGAIENVQQQLQDAVMGAIPDGSIGHNALDQGLRDTLTGLQDSLTDETAAREQTDQSLQQQIDLKCQIVMGTYTGNGNSTQTINLGFQPRAVLVVSKRGSFSQSASMFGGLAVHGPLPGTRMAASIAENGFTVYKDDYVESNSSSSHFNPFTYIAFM